MSFYCGVSRMLRLRFLVQGCFLLGMLATAMQSAQAAPPPFTYNADMVTQWNEITLNALRTGDTVMKGPGWSTRNLAMVHAAMYDAVNSVNPTHMPIYGITATPAGTSQEAAAAQAAFTVLSSLYPAQQAYFNSSLNTTLASIPNSVSKSNGIALGTTVGNGVIAARANDRSANDATTPYFPLNNPGNFQISPPLNPNMRPLGPGWGNVQPFVMQHGAQFRAPAPPTLTSAQYTAEYNEVKTLGAATGSTRTADQTEIGIFWGYDHPSFGTPPVLYNQIARQIGILAGNTLEENARMLALVNISLGDAGIAAWDTKYAYNNWRPYNGIRDGDSDGNPLTIGDPTWEPLGAPGANGDPNFTPPFPDYVSGHATFGAAAFKTVEHFYHTNSLNDIIGGPLTIGSEEFPGTVSRSYNTLSQMIEENGRSRIYLGIHWESSNQQGQILGGKVADLVAGTMMVPVPEPGTIGLMIAGAVGGLVYFRRRRAA
jgi:hypothetical protein